ncbi:MAG TPA: hypothetical protein DCM05_01270 [Elusimicrobia bacterium]|nr:hypothetical protein [Elusimicrobiota bacterium]
MTGTYGLPGDHGLGRVLAHQFAVVHPAREEEELRLGIQPRGDHQRLQRVPRHAQEAGGETYFSLIKFNSARVEVALDCVPIRLYM